MAAGSFRHAALLPLVAPPFLGVELGDAIVQRDIGGRVTPAVIRDVAYISHLVETKAPDGRGSRSPSSTTDCGSTLLADDELRHSFAMKIGVDE